MPPSGAAKRYQPVGMPAATTTSSGGTPTPRKRGAAARGRRKGLNSSGAKTAAPCEIGLKLDAFRNSTKNSESRQSKRATGNRLLRWTRTSLKSCSTIGIRPGGKHNPISGTMLPTTTARSRWLASAGTKRGPTARGSQRKPGTRSGCPPKPNGKQPPAAKMRGATHTGRISMLPAATRLKATSGARRRSACFRVATRPKVWPI